MSKTLEECKSQDPKARSFEVAGQAFVFRKPKAIEWRAYKGAALSAKMGKDGGQVDGLALYDAFEELSKAVVISHTPQELDNLSEDYLNLFLELGSGIAGAIEAEMDSFGKKPDPASTKP